VWALVSHETSEVYVTVLGDWRRACESLMPADEQLLPSCVLVDNSNAEINASRSAYIRVFVMNKLLQTGAASIVHVYTNKMLHVFLAGRQHSFLVVNMDDIAAWRVYTS
jgi:hypothetical protein